MITTQGGKILRNTRKKTKVIGKETYIKQDTGEITEMNVVEIEERDANFHKLWLGHILQTLDIIGNQKIKVVNYILENINSENVFIGTQRNIAENIDVSTKTVNVTIKALIESDFMAFVQDGVYRINPNVIFKGGKDRRMNILYKYYNDKKEGEVDNEGK